MLHRKQRFGAQFTVPVVRRPGERPADDLLDKFEAVTGAALAERERRDGHVTAGLEKARARARFFNLIREAEETGEDGKGLVKRVDAEFKTYKKRRLSSVDNEHARGAMKAGFDALGREMAEKAVGTEAKARARGRIEAVGKAIDNLVAAVAADPTNFAAMYQTAREGIDRLGLPAKVSEAFTNRLSEIPKAALSALAKKNPAAAIKMIKQRSGAADPVYGVDRSAVRVIGKQAEAERLRRENEQASSDTLGATRTIINAKSAIDAVKNGKAPASSLAGWIAHSEAIGKGAVRELRRESDEALAHVETMSKSAAHVREVLARGEKIDPNDKEHIEGLDHHYEQSAAESGSGPGGVVEARDQRSIQLAKAAKRLPKGFVREILMRFKTDDLARAAGAAQLIDALERADPALLKGIDADVLRDAQSVIAAAEAGIDWTDAVRMVRESIDLPAKERETRGIEFARLVDGSMIAKIIGEVFGVTVAGISDGASGTAAA